MSDATTEGIRISVRPSYWAERSTPALRQFAFAYHVTIENVGEEPAQLLDRHWMITDGNGVADEVRGEGVVGQQPRVLPGRRFEYTSWVMLRTPFGSMRGSYAMVRPGGRRFEATVAEFALVQPHGLH